MVLGCTGGQSHQRGVSNIVGVVLLVGLVIGGATIVVMLGGSTLDSVAAETHSDVAADSMQEAASGLQSISGSSTDSSTTFEFSNRLQGQLNLETTSASVTVSVSSATDSRTVTRHMGTIVYKQGDDVLALQGGGVWQYTNDGVSMVTEPSFGYADEQLDLTVVDLQNAGTISKGTIIASQEVEQSRAATESVMGQLRTVWDDPSVSDVDVTVTIDSQFAQAWADYARDNFGSKPHVEAITVTDSNTVEIVFTDLPTDPSSATSTSGGPITSTSTSSSTESADTATSTSVTSSSSEETDSTSSSSSDTSGDRNCNTDDRNRGHGNDCDGYDEDNPGNSDGTAQASDADGDGLTDEYDDCPGVPGGSATGCPVLDASGDELRIYADGGQLTYLGTQSGVVTQTQVERDVRDPMDVVFVLDESGSMVDAHSVGSITTPGTYQVPDGQGWYKYERGRYGQYRYVRSYGPGSTVDVAGNQLVMRYAEASDPTGERIDATEAFIDDLDSAHDRAGVVQFDTDAWTTHALSSDFGAVTDSLEPAGGGSTDIAEAIDLSTSKLRDADDDRVMVVLSDGQQTQPGDPVAEARAAADDDITIYTVGLGSNVDAAMLRDVAAETGGSYYHADDASQLESVFEQIADDSTTETAHYIDHQVTTMAVEAGSAGGTLGADGSFGSALNLNDPSVVDPVDPSPRSYTLSGIQPGSTLSVTTSLQSCSTPTETEITQTHDGETYTHRVCDGGSTALTQTDYQVYTDGERLSRSTLEWWQQDASSLLDDVDAEIRGGKVRLPDDDQALIVVEGINGYSLMLFDAADVDRPPVAKLSISDSGPLAGETVTLDASASYDPDDDEIVAYKFDDGDWQSSPTFETSFSSDTTTEVTVKTDDGQTASTTLDVTLNDRPPVAELVGDDPVRVGETVSLDASGSYDPESDDSIVDVRWSATVDSPTSGDATATTVFDSAGTKSVTVVVENDDGQTARTTLQIDVTNSSPAATLTASDDRVYPGEDVTFDVTGLSDPDPRHTPAVDHWIVGGSRVDSDSPTLTESFTTTGSKAVTAVIESGPDTIRPTVTVDVNSQPVAHLAAQSDVDPGTTVELDGSGSYDPDGDSLAYTFTVLDEPSGSSATALSASTPPSKAEVTLDEAGTYTVQLTVEDEHGATASTKVMLTAGTATSSAYSPVDVNMVEIDIEDD